jgi:hypothetical protein
MGIMPATDPPFNPFVLGELREDIAHAIADLKRRTKGEPSTVAPLIASNFSVFLRRPRNSAAEADFARRLIEVLRGGVESRLEGLQTIMVDVDDMLLAHQGDGLTNSGASAGAQSGGIEHEGRSVTGHGYEKNWEVIAEIGHGGQGTVYEV